MTEVNAVWRGRQTTRSRILRSISGRAKLLVQNLYAYFSAMAHEKCVVSPYHELTAGTVRFVDLARWSSDPLPSGKNFAGSKKKEFAWKVTDNLQVTRFLYFIPCVYPLPWSPTYTLLAINLLTRIKQATHCTPLFSSSLWFDCVWSMQHAVTVPLPLQIPRFQVWGSNPSQDNSTFPGLGFESQSRQLFGMWFQWQLILINQSIDKVIHKIFSIDWPLQKVGRREKSGKKILTGIRTPDLETWNWKCHVCWLAGHARHAVEEKDEKRPMIAYCFTQYSHGCSFEQKKNR